MTRRGAALVILLLGPAVVAQAAEPRPVEAFTLRAGDTVRMWDAAGNRIRGKGGIVAADESGLSVVVKGDAEIIPFSSLQRMEVRRGRRHHELGAWIGAAAALVTYVIVKEEQGETGGPRRALGWTAVGAAAGASVGAFVLGPHWHAVPLDRFRPAPAPAARISLRFRF